MIRILIGGSPCTHWSIAQSKNRETTAEGEGWELFKNFLIARERYEPDLFLYENNKSAAQPIKRQIAAELGAPLQYINSALVSAQRRERFYVHNFGYVPPPADRGIMLQDILEGAAPRAIFEKYKEYRRGGQLSFFDAEDDTEGAVYLAGNMPDASGVINDSQSKRVYAIDGKARVLNACTNSGGSSDTAAPHTGLYAIPAEVEPEAIAIHEKAYTLRASAGGHAGQSGPLRHIVSGGQFGYMGVPVRIGTIEHNSIKEIHDSKQYRVYSPEGKAITLCGEGGGAGAKTGLYAVPIGEFKAIDYAAHNTAKKEYEIAISDEEILCKHKGKGSTAQGYCVYLPTAEKSRTLLSNQARNEKVIMPLESVSEFAAVDYTPLDGYDVVITDEGIRSARKDGGGEAQGYHVQFASAPKTRALLAEQARREKIIVPIENAPNLKPVYRVGGEAIEIKGKQYPIRLPDGLYIIRKLTVTECCRLQTLPDDYCRAVSPTQAYRGLGNGWTAEVIIHLLSHALRDVSKDEEIEVLSMYDGIGTGRYCFDRLGYTNITYYAYETDKHAIKIAMSNYPDIRQMGDAFSVRDADWPLAADARRTAI